MTVNVAELHAKKELTTRIKELVGKHQDQNLYAAKTREAVCKDIAGIRDELVDKYKASVPAVALYVADYGKTLKAKFLVPTLLKGDGCVGFCKEAQGGGIGALQVENLNGPRN